MTLYISDLDGTLLNAEPRLSEETLLTINRLIDEGMQFTIATARSWDSAHPLIAPLCLQQPLILHNGVFIYDPMKEKNIIENVINDRLARDLLRDAAEFRLNPIVFAITPDSQRKVYYQGVFNHGEAIYIEDRLSKADQRFALVSEYDSHPMAAALTVLLIGSKEELTPMFEKVIAEYDLTCHFAEDIYSKAYWLEITHRNANKGWAVQYLKRYLNAAEVVCFGDHLNDLSMFDAADRKYAVENGHDTLKQAATGVIASNLANGVARFLSQQFVAQQKMA